jgi:CRISPR-associated protein Cmr2
VSQVFWQAKIWGILHDPVLKALHSNSGRSKNAPWRELEVMRDWVDNNIAPESDSPKIKSPNNLVPKKAKIKSGGKAMKQIKLADLITSASDRGAIGSLPISIDYAAKDSRDRGLDIFHLLSGAHLEFKLQHQHEQLIQAGNQDGGRVKFLTNQEDSLFDLQIKDTDGNWKEITKITDYKKLFWWLWRCLPIATCKLMGDDPTLLLMPAETRIPDASIWSHTSLTGAMAGALTGFDLTIADLKKWPSKQKQSRAYLATFSFTPVQEVIKASRKMRDFWASSWLLHYLSAQVSWRLALKYGPDSLIYPSLFQQALIDDLLLAKWPDFDRWIKKPSERQLLTAGFPNVIVILLPEAKVAAAMQFAKQALDEEWLKIGDLVLSELQSDHWKWMRELERNHRTWNGWLEHQWQTYWSAMPVGDRDQELTSNSKKQPKWQQAQNQTFQLIQSQGLFTADENDFLREAANQKAKTRSPSNVNIGSWWPYIFNLNHANLAAVKNARSWKLPTVFDTRSTVSGLGPIVHFHPLKYKLTTKEASDLWPKLVGLFDGKEQLNATEVVKRALHLVIPKLIPGLENQDEKIKAAYPDLTAGLAGYLKTHWSEEVPSKHVDNFRLACQAIKGELSRQNFRVQNLPEFCGIPWLEEQASLAEKKYHPRHLSPSWLIEDIKNVTDEVMLKKNLDNIVTEYYPGNNPADWYVLAFGDGDDMREWLKGEGLQKYRNYVPGDLMEKARSSSRAAQPQDLANALDKFLDQKKRMGPSTHVALSRSLLDFSNQLVPYLTEQRYAGRLIYSGGDDVLAYTNLWEWDSWLWDIRACFQGQADPHSEKPFDNDGNYWRWKDPATLPHNLSSRPLFTMGENATISFGIVIANQGVPLAIALENMWEAEKAAKNHFCPNLKQNCKKNAVQVRVLYANGNILQATAKFEAFAAWRGLLQLNQKEKAALFEQAAQIWAQHPVPCAEAIEPWVRAFTDRRDALKNADSQGFINALSGWLQEIWKTTDEIDRVKEIGSWLKLAAFVIRKRQIEIKGG